MNAEALIGTVLGTCTLQKLIGRGTMGVVFRAQQSHPPRQVAVKVLLPKVPQAANQRTIFVERFRREIDAAASLDHPNIVSVYAYGEYNGLAYLVMPYISGGTLCAEMERQGMLSLPKVIDYLDQLAAALDYAHERGFIHRDVKPANILLTPEEHLLLTDFGLVKVVTEGQTPQMRLTGAGVSMGTADYMAPEQVIGDHIDSRADLYSLGVILYQMVTGTTPFHGEAPMQIAVQHLQVPPPSPKMLRTDLPVAAEQVMLRALAKRPEDRYGRAQDIASAFRVALTAAGVELSSLEAGTATRLFTPRARGLFDPVWQTGARPSVGNDLSAGKPMGILPTTSTTPPPPTGILSTTGNTPLPPTGLFHDRTTTPTPPTNDLPPTSATRSSPIRGLLGRTRGLLRSADGTGRLPTPVTADNDNAIAPTSTGALPASTEIQLPATHTTGALAAPNGEQKAPNTIKLTSPVKVVQVPIAGQPGRYITGLLPIPPQMQPPAEKTDAAPASTTTKKDETGTRQRLKMLALITAVVLVIFGSGTFWFVHSRSAQIGGTRIETSNPTPNLRATAAARATATAGVNIILSDPLSQNIHNWTISSSGSKIYVFKNGAYHITDNDNTQGAPAILSDVPGEILSGPLGYTLTMEEIQGNDSSINNSFGMIVRFRQQNRGGKIITQFYTFEVVNAKGGEYQFWKYDDSKGGSPWTKIWHQPFGSEFHLGHGPNSVNTFKIFMNGNSFTLIVNGKRVESTHDGSIASGAVGMLVNLKGTEVAFSNLLLTRN